AIAAPWPGQPAALDGQDSGVLLACTLLRLRVLRLALAATLRRQMFDPDPDLASLTAPQNGVPGQTAGALGTEIAAALGLEGGRFTPEAPPWPQLSDATPPGSGDRRAARAHQAAEDLAAAFIAFEASCAGVGPAFEQEQDQHLLDRADALGGRLGMPAGAAARMQALRMQGLELHEQPSRGLLGLPGAVPSAFAITSLGIPIAGRYASEQVALSTTRNEARAPRLRYDHDSLYVVQCWVRVAGRDACEAPQLLWTLPTEPFAIAEPTDVLGAKPATIQLPDIPRLIRDIPRIAKARARPFAAFAAPPNSSYLTGDDPKDTQRAWGIGWICSFAIPVITICAFILFSIIFSILIVLPGFFWMLLLKFCIPVPKRSS
ncbi:MAG: hypothetical protein ACOYOH_07160, partial [Paracraurococcus sp.]